MVGDLQLTMQPDQSSPAVHAELRDDARERVKAELERTRSEKDIKLRGSNLLVICRKLPSVRLIFKLWDSYLTPIAWWNSHLNELPISDSTLMAPDARY